MTDPQDHTQTPRHIPSQRVHDDHCPADYSDVTQEFVPVEDPSPDTDELEVLEEAPVPYVPVDAPVPDKDSSHAPQREVLELICGLVRGLHLHKGRFIKLEADLVPDSDTELFLGVTQVRFQHGTDLHAEIVFHIAQTTESEIPPGSLFTQEKPNVLEIGVPLHDENIGLVELNPGEEQDR